MRLLVVISKNFSVKKVFARTMLLVKNFKVLLRKHHCVRLGLRIRKLLDLHSR
jgi:hypothetical protein